MSSTARTGRSRMKQTPTGRLVMQVETRTTRLVHTTKAESLDQLGERTVVRWANAGPEDVRALVAGEIEPPLWIVPSRVRALAPALALAALAAVITNLAVAGLALVGAQMAHPDPAGFLAAALSPQALGLAIGGAIAAYTLITRRTIPRNSRA